MPYWYNVDTRTVEEAEERSRNASVLGPYATRAEAERALDHARENTASWDAQEEAEREEHARDVERHGSINPFEQG